MAFTYRENILAVLSTGRPDIAGYEVEARDGHIGKVDEATYDADLSCLVVDTGHWIFGHKRMIPAGMVERIDPAECKVYLTMTKDEIRGAPNYDADRHRDDPAGHHNEHRTYYDSFLWHEPLSQRD